MDDTGFNLADALARVRQNDETAARELVEHLYPLVIRIVRAHLPRRGAEEELAQDVFLKVFTKLGQYRSAAPFEHWVSRIAANHCRTAIRAERFRPEWRMADLSEDHEQALWARHGGPDEVPHPARAIAAKEIVDMLLAALSPRDRVIIRLLELEGRSVAEISRITGLPATVIRVRAFRARRKLNRHFGRLWKEGRL